jgi:heterotetrameric sarcosine oxidase gamma subunit
MATERLPQALARTPLHHWHAARGARFIEQDGWQIAVSYSEVAREVAVVRSGLGLVDVSAFAKISYGGFGVASLAEELLGDSPASRPHGVALCNAGGSALACRLAEDYLLLLALHANVALVSDRLGGLKPDLPAVKADVSSGYAMFSLVGPCNNEVLRSLTALDLESSAFPAGSCAEASLAGVHALLVRPPEMKWEWGFVAVAWDLGEYVWEHLLEAGRRHGLQAIGLEAFSIVCLGRILTN